MYFDRIEIDSFGTDLCTETGRGTVALLSDTTRVTFALPVPSTHCTTERRRTLIAEALRQLRQMPEFRTGGLTPSFAPGLLPPGLAA